MRFVKPFMNLSKGDAAIAWGKGASLGEMLQAWIPVPDGFVVLADSFDHFIRETGIDSTISAILSTVDVNLIHSGELVSQKIQELILAQKMPKTIEDEIVEYFKQLDAWFVAVRSSATSEDSADAAWAGQLESYLNTTDKTLLQNVQRCWASLFTPRAIVYRFEKWLQNTHISVAVVVQKMVDSEVSGIAFSVHPVTQDRNTMIIEAGYGLGEAIVSGAVTPDSYILSKIPSRIVERNIATQLRSIVRWADGGIIWKDVTAGSVQKLSDSQIMTLGGIIQRIENHYGFPCDIEWWYENGEFFIVQSRPITTLHDAKINTRQTFKKAYTRNFSIIMQQAWFYANREGFMDRVKIDQYPYKHPYVYFMKDGVEEVWENTEANAWLFDQLISKLKTDSNFFFEIYNQYYSRLSEIEKIWKKGVTTLSELDAFIDSVYQRTSDFVILYGCLNWDSVPAQYQELANKFRETDVFFSQCNITIMQALATIFPDLGYLSVYITREEISQNVSRAELIQRDLGFALIPDTFKGSTTFDGLTQMLPEYYFALENWDFDGKVLRWQVAFAGKATWKVRIVKRVDQLENITSDEVIVSPMTTPDFVFAMKQAAAFVTDEGGITCHAAIIARELGKPCIIGTKIASSALRDGDLIEVDANNGAVRILERAEWSVPAIRQGDSIVTVAKPVDEFIELMTGRKFWPPLNNYTFFGQGSAFNTTKYFKDYYPELPPLHLIIVSKEWESVQMLPSDTIEYTSKYMFAQYLKGTRETEKRFLDFNETESRISALYNEYRPAKISQTPTEELLTTMEMIRTEIWSLNCYILFTLYFDKEICLEVLKNEKSSITETELSNIWDKATHPAVESFEKAQYRSVLRSIADGKTSEMIAEDARFIFSNYYAVENIQTVQEKINSMYGLLSQAEAQEKILELDSELLACQWEFQQWLDTLTQDKGRIVWYLQRIIEYRDRRKNLFAKAYVIWWQIYEKVISEAWLDLALAPHIQFDELIRWSEYLQSHKEEILARRDWAVLLIKFDGTIKIEPVEFGEAKKKLTDFYIRNTTAGTKEGEIKGQIGAPGKIVGKVEIILDAKKSQHFTPGAILVTGMTRPEFVPLMKLASAIVTDEGGITCHAAIIARELGKPCIIGTKIATRTLKDGDLVEVDADNGIVRILERKEWSVPAIKQSIEAIQNWLVFNSSGYPYLLGVWVRQWTAVPAVLYPDFHFITLCGIRYTKQWSEVQYIASSDEYRESAKTLFADIGKLEKFYQDFTDSEEELREFFSQIEEKDDDFLFENYHEFMSRYDREYAIWALIDGFLIFSDELFKGLREKYAPHEDLMQDLIQPYGETFNAREHKSLLQIAVAAKNGIPIDDQLAEHQKSFHWILNNYKKIDPLPVSYFRQQLDGLLARDITSLEEEITLLNTAINLQREKCEKIKNLGVFTQLDYEKLLWLGKIAWWVDRRKECNLRANYFIGRYLQLASKHYNIAYEDIVFLFPHELTQIIAGDIKISDISIQDRKGDFVHLYDKYDQELILTGSEKNEFLAKVMPKTDGEKMKEIPGSTANRWVVRWVVRVVMDAHNAPEFNDGEILVTGMTRPDFLGLMKKAAAFVTDEGGITCHAAIVARELGKPCIIGTKIATRTLKDGDLVEVDADNGIVRVLSA